MFRIAHILIVCLLIAIVSAVPISPAIDMPNDGFEINFSPAIDMEDSKSNISPSNH